MCHSTKEQVIKIARRQYMTLRVGDSVIYVELAPLPGKGYEVKVTEAEVGGPPRPKMDSTLHPTPTEAHDYFITMCRRQLDEADAMPAYHPTAVSQEEHRIVTINPDEEQQ